MAHNDIPKGAGLGRDADRRRPGLVDYNFTMQHGSRAQRREILRQMKMYARQGVPGAAAELQRMTAFAEQRTALKWRVYLPDREPFVVVCPQRATANQIIAQWPGAAVEVVYD